MLPNLHLIEYCVNLNGTNRYPIYFRESVVCYGDVISPLVQYGNGTVSSGLQKARKQASSLSLKILIPFAEHLYLYLYSAGPVLH